MVLTPAVSTASPASRDRNSGRIPLEKAPREAGKAPGSRAGRALAALEGHRHGTSLRVEGITSSENRRGVWVGKDPKDDPLGSGIPGIGAATASLLQD